MTRLRLRTRVTIWFAASLLAILTPILAGLLALQWRSMRAQLDHHLEEDLEVAAEMLVFRDGGITWRTDAERDYGYDAGPRRWVEVHAEGGRVLYLRGAAAELTASGVVPRPDFDEEGFATLRTPAGAYVRTFSMLRRFGDVDALVRVARGEGDLRRDLVNLVLVFSILAPLAVLAAAIAGHVVSGRALAPLSRMAERARTITAEQLSARLPIENPEDELGQLAVVFNDTFGRLQASFVRLKQFAADASHELRTPLTAIRSVGEVGLREPRDPEAYQEIIGSMLEEADRLAGMVDTLLTLARWERGRAKADTDPVDLAILAEEIVGQLSVLAEDRGIRVQLAAGEPASAVVDATMIRQAITNVVDNAIKFSPDGSTVHVSVERQAAEVAVIVDDEGPGIPPDERARVLERFYRVPGTTSGATRGSGLGLAIVYWAVVANHGRLDIADAPLGGARVTLRLPAS